MEKALDKKESKIPKEMEIGFHNGALSTLINERHELARIIQQVENLMHTHIKRLEELGVKIKR